MLMQGQGQNGFSLVELVTVILLISVLSVVALSRLDGLDAFEEKAFFDEVVAAVRYAQKLARATGCPVQVLLTSSSYQLKQGDSCVSTTFSRNVLHPKDRSEYANLTFPSAYSISPAATLVFTAKSEVTVTPLTSNPHEFSVGSYSFRIYEKTGLVEVN